MWGAPSGALFYWYINNNDSSSIKKADFPNLEFPLFDFMVTGSRPHPFR